MNAIGYVRVSTDKQVDLGVSLDAQTKIRAMAVVQSASLDDIIIDAGESAKSLHRPGMARVLALVEAGAVDTVIIAKLDRLTRSVADLAESLKRFERRDVSLVSVADSLDTHSAAGRLVLNIMVRVSQWEREAIGERTRDAMRLKRAKGERVGTVPFGYRVGADGVWLDANGPEQAMLSNMYQLRAQGYTTRQIATELNRLGLATRRGTAWRFQYVAQALLRLRRPRSSTGAFDDGCEGMAVGLLASTIATVRQGRCRRSRRRLPRASGVRRGGTSGGAIGSSR